MPLISPHEDVKRPLVTGWDIRPYMSLLVLILLSLASAGGYSHKAALAKRAQDEYDLAAPHWNSSHAQWRIDQAQEFYETEYAGKVDPLDHESMVFLCLVVFFGAFAFHQLCYLIVVWSEI